MSLVPYVVEQTSRGERSYDIFSRLPQKLQRIGCSVLLAMNPVPPFD